MKIFVVNKKSFILYCVLLVCALAVLAIGNSGIVSVMNVGEGERLLPIYNVEKGDEKVCSITFDAAWDDLDTDKLIEILNQYQVKATFFMVGSWVEKYPESVKKFADNGHEIMNHSDTHPHINQLSEEKIVEEITKCADKIEAATGKRPNLFRGPYGEYNNTVLQAASTAGHQTIQWDVDSLDWKDLAVDDIVARVTKRVKPGSIVLFHNGAKNTPEALPKILEKLIADGYRIVPVGELIYQDNFTIDHRGKQIPQGSEPAPSSAVPAPASPDPLAQQEQESQTSQTQTPQIAEDSSL